MGKLTRRTDDIPQRLNGTTLKGIARQTQIVGRVLQKEGRRSRIVGLDGAAECQNRHEGSQGYAHHDSKGGRWRVVEKVTQLYQSQSEGERDESRVKKRRSGRFPEDPLPPMQGEVVTRDNPPWTANNTKSVGSWRESSDSAPQILRLGIRSLLADEGEGMDGR
jgi:hypothetical protein